MISIRTLRILCWVIIAFVSIFGAMAIWKHYNQKDGYRKLPNIMVSSILEGDIYLAANTNKYIKTILVFFNTDCDLCKEEISGIIENGMEITNVNWFFISNSSVEEIQKFLLSTQIQIIPNTHIISDNDLKLYELFHVTNNPTTIIYDMDGNLIWVREGIQEIGVLMKVIK